MFKTEYLVSVPPNARFYVDRADVRVLRPPASAESLGGKVKAYLVEYQGNQAVIEITGTPVVGGLRISVPKAITSDADR
jgi:hypothetical protein